MHPAIFILNYLELLQDKVSKDLPEYSLGLEAFNELRKWADTSAEEYALLHAKRDAAAGCPALGLRFAFPLAAWNMYARRHVFSCIGHHLAKNVLGAAL